MNPGSHSKRKEMFWFLEEYKGRAGSIPRPEWFTTSLIGVNKKRPGKGSGCGKYFFVAAVVDEDIEHEKGRRS
ncbi:MAG TPA: hypothetical protein PLU80_12895 [Acidobacteriota bacterium]|nr:hypothetical protein [Acidobacteriota bacterium]